MKTKSQEDEFYTELDAKTLRRSCCTAQTMLIFFALLLVGAIVVTFYCYREIKKINFSSKVIFATAQDKKNFSDKLELEPDETSFEITITSKELTAVTTEGISKKNLIIKNIQIIIQKESVEFFGSLVKPLSSQIKIETVPKVDNGKIKFEIRRLTAGNLSVPKFINNTVADAINETMDQNFNNLYETAEVQEIWLFDDKMIIGGKLK